jgi:ubiquinone biosynthesis protein UbiJ
MPANKITDLFLKPVELLLNRGLHESTTAAAIARDLEGRTLALRVEATPLDLRIRIADGRIRVTAPDSGTADAAISGSPIGLGRLLGADPQATVREGAVQVSGDSEIADAFRDLLRYASPDFEEELSRLVGDPLAHQAGNAVRGLARWNQAAARTLTRSIGEYLTEESGVLPTRQEMQDFSRAVDELVNAVARAEARVQRAQRDRAGMAAAPKENRG